jgi:hypothetical protein
VHEANKFLVIADEATDSARLVHEEAENLVAKINA